MSAPPGNELAIQSELRSARCTRLEARTREREPEFTRMTPAERWLTSTPPLRKESAPRAIGLSTPSLMRLLDTCDAIRDEDANSAEQIAYMARLLVQTTLPHRDPGAIEVWVRRNGNFTLQITPGRTVASARTTSRRLGIPYGTYPRLIMTFLTTEAVRTRSPEVYLGRSLNSLH
jgi:hypothetical protein